MDTTSCIKPLIGDQWPSSRTTHEAPPQRVGFPDPRIAGLSPDRRVDHDEPSSFNKLLLISTFQEFPKRFERSIAIERLECLERATILELSGYD